MMNVVPMKAMLLLTVFLAANQIYSLLLLTINSLVPETYNLNLFKSTYITQSVIIFVNVLLWT